MLQPPSGFGVRPATLDDVEALAEVVNACSVAETGEVETSAESIRGDLTAPGRSPEDAMVLETVGGEVVGFLQVWGDLPPYDEIGTIAWVLPELWGRGLSAFLLRLGEERGRARLSLSPPGVRVVVHAFRFLGNEPAGVLLRSLGFAPVRVFRDMRIDLATPTASPQDVPDVTIRTFVRNADERALHAALAEAFEDHWGHIFPTFERFVHQQIEGAGARFDPTTWWLATHGDEIVGASLCRAGDRHPANAIVTDLAVRRAWRGRGIGMALLLTSFDGLRAAGFEAVELGVDAESLTGATRLYERAGMHVAKEWEVWEKELRSASA